MTEYQFRKYYGPKLTGDEWSPWEDVTEGRVFYSPRTHLENLENSGIIEFRVKPTCGVCYLPEVEDSGLCEHHLDVERGLYDYEPEDPWPDFHDEKYDGYWNTQEEWEPSR